MPPSPSTKLYLMGQKLRDSQEPPYVLPKELEEPPRREVIKPLKRPITIEEVFALYDQILAANSSWMAPTIENKRRVCELFTDPNDPRISHRLDLNDMKTAATILSATLDRVPKPEAPKFERAEDLESWQLPVPSPEYILRKADKRTLQDYITRAKAYEKWVAEQNQ